MAQKEVRLRRFLDSAVCVPSQGQGRALTAKTADGAWFVWGEVPVARASTADCDSLEVEVYSVAQPVELRVRDALIKIAAVNGAGMMFLTEEGELFQALVDFEEVAERELVVAASEAVPISLPINQSILQFCCGEDFTLLLTRAGQVFSFGNGTNGQLGHGDLHEREQPILVESLAQLTIGSIAVGSHHCLAFCDNDDRIYSWGAGSRGQLGNGQTQDKFTPDSIAIEDADTSYVTLSCGRETSGAVTSDGKAYVWGSNGYRQLGLAASTDVLVPTQVDLYGTDVVQLLLGEGMSVARTRDRRIYGWGRKLPWIQGDGLPQLLLTHQQLGEQMAGSTVQGVALLNRQVFCQTEDALLRCTVSVPPPATRPDPKLLRLVMLIYGHVRTRDREAMARALQKWKKHMNSAPADVTTQLKACAVRMLASMLKTSLTHRTRKYWSRWRDDAQERRVTARMDAITSEYQTSLHRMRRTKSDLQDEMQQYRANVRSTELKLSKTIGAKRVAAISLSQIVRRVRAAFQRWKLISDYSTEATQLRNDRYKLEIGMYQLTTKQKEVKDIETQAQRMQTMLAAVTAFYRWKLGAERWKMQVLQEEFQSERATVVRELNGLLAQINKVNAVEREAVLAARARGSTVIQDLFTARKFLQDATESPSKQAKQAPATAR